jgi:hypothetical protein
MLLIIRIIRIRKRPLVHRPSIGGMAAAVWSVYLRNTGVVKNNEDDEKKIRGAIGGSANAV